MIPALVSRGYAYRAGLLSPDHTRFIAGIPKNATSYLGDWALRYGWVGTAGRSIPGIRELIIVLRDPVDRWVSGISQYICTYILSVFGPNGPVFDEAEVTEHDYFFTADKFIEQYTDLTERILFDAASRFDDHVWPQSELVDGMMFGIPRTYFMVGPDLTQQLSEYLGLPIIEGLDRNSGQDNPEQKKIQAFIRSRLEKRPELAVRLKRHYKTDYDLINSVQFYGR